MKISSLAVGGAVAAVALASALAPTSAFAASTVSFDKTTLCPGETLTVTINGLSDGTVVNLTAPEYALTFPPPGYFNYAPTANTGPIPYSALAGFVGQTYELRIVSNALPNDPSSVGITLASATTQILSQCATPPTDPTTPTTPTAPEESLPDTGISADVIGFGAFAAVSMAGAGFALVRRARRTESTL